MDLQHIVILAVFAGVILAIAINVIDMAVAAMLGVSTLIIFGIFTRQDILNAVQAAGGPLSLLFGGMVVARPWSRPVFSSRSASGSCPRRMAAANAFCWGSLPWCPCSTRFFRMPPQ
jgi:hypothetical protein